MFILFVCDCDCDCDCACDCDCDCDCDCCCCCCCCCCCSSSCLYTPQMSLSGWPWYGEEARGPMRQLDLGDDFRGWPLSRACLTAKQEICMTYIEIHGFPSEILEYRSWTGGFAVIFRRAFSWRAAGRCSYSLSFLQPDTEYEIQIDWRWQRLGDSFWMSLSCSQFAGTWRNHFDKVCWGPPSNPASARAWYIFFRTISIDEYVGFGSF